MESEPASASLRVVGGPGRRLKSTSPLIDLAADDIDVVMGHPEQRRVFERITELLGQLDECDEPRNHAAFQDDLLGEVLRVERARGERARVRKRLRAGVLPAERPEVADGRDPTQLATWELEEYICARLSRQLRTVGDALAWRCFGLDRRLVLALSRNASPGVMYGKQGLVAEREFVRHLWAGLGHFGLMHDLTNCLRIADVTEFAGGGRMRLHEVKTAPRFVKSQQQRAQAVIDALTSGGQLPGGADSRFVEVSTPYRTDLVALNDVIQLAKRDGCRGMKLKPGRALVAMSLTHAATRWSDNPALGSAAYTAERASAIRRAGIATASHHLTANTGDTAARSPIMAPFALYPFTARDRAALICDLVLVETIIDVDALIGALHDVGLTATNLLPEKNSRLAGDQAVLEVRWQSRGMTLHNQGLSILTYELLRPDTWARGIKDVITSVNPPGEPVVVFTNERAAWLA